jgi:hypothetical protein
LLPPLVYSQHEDTSVIRLTYRDANGRHYIPGLVGSYQEVAVGLGDCLGDMGDVYCKARIDRHIGNPSLPAILGTEGGLDELLDGGCIICAGSAKIEALGDVGHFAGESAGAGGVSSFDD